ncbi:fibronectin type III domain-containing protein [Nocardioides speluncae]|uniref:fibronectin type III domain-containing protein n=1 Tax=Nocardioides speluncae TaxID=2670337 RepID=UPI0013795F5C|nr:fibronectin type III domain-containing protein [Nocardioides speluncae]
MKDWIGAFVALAVLAALLQAVQVATAAPARADDPSCKPYIVLGSRGSGQKMDNPPSGLGNEVNDFTEKLKAKLPADSVEVWANPYPAMNAVVGGIGDLATWIDLLLNQNQNLSVGIATYTRSVASGIAVLKDQIEHEIERCSQSKLILAGYSQGAQVSADVYELLSPEQRGHVLGMAMWGDPRFNGASKAVRGDFNPKRGGMLNFLYSKRPEFPDHQKVASYCHDGDPICQGIRTVFRMSQHLNYHTVGDAASTITYTQRAATFIAALANRPGEPGAPIAEITPPDPNDLVPNTAFALSAAQSLDADGVPDSYAWDYGNGFVGTMTLPFIILTLPAGDHTVTLRVTSNSGQVATDSITLHISPPGAFTGPPGSATDVVSTPAADGQSAVLTWQPPASGPPVEGYTVSSSDGFPLYVSRSPDARTLRLPADSLPVNVVVTAYNRIGDAPPTTPVTMRAADWSASSDLNKLWREYGDAGGHWTGGDRTASIQLPDGRVAWLFSDTFLGAVNADHSRPASSPMVNNTLVVQGADGRLGQTLHGGTTAAPKAKVAVDGSSLQYWVGDGLVAGDELQVLYNTYEKTGEGGLDVRMTGTSLVTFSLPGLAVTNIRALPLGDTIAWGSAVLNDDDYTYVYGSSDPGDGTRFAHVARMPHGALGGGWQFFTGSGWSSSEADAGRLFRGVGTAFSVVEVGGKYALVTADTNLTFSPAYVGYTADSPTGPFTGPVHLFEAPQEYPGKPVITYDAHVHSAFGSGGNLVVSYNVNSLNDKDNYADARIYRPRFVKVAWPRPTPDPGGLPAAPTGLTASATDDGLVKVRWDPVPGTGIKYRLYQRDVTAGQTMFSRYAGGTTATSMDLSLLKDDHTYEFKVTAENAVGEGPFSNTASLTLTLRPPPAPANLTATATGKGEIVLDWTATSQNVLYTVYKRDITAGETAFTNSWFPDPWQTTHTVKSLLHGHEYEFKVTAKHGGGESDPSNLARATAVYDKPPAPTSLTATAQDDGTIKLDWTAPPGEPVWYLIYQRDVTENPDAEFTQWAYPSTGATTATAGYLAHNHRYEFKVTATSQGGEGPASNVASAVSTYPRPGAPTGLTAVAGDGKVDLEWTAPPGPDVWYWVYYRNVDRGATDFTRSAYPITNGPRVSMGWLTNGDTYEFKVTATNQAGEGPDSNTVSARPLPPKPGKVTGLTATPRNDGTIKLDWANPGGSNYYWVYSRDVTDGEGFKRWTYPATTTEAVAGLLEHNHVYEFKVEATNLAGDGPASDVVRATSSYALPGAPTNLAGTSAGDGSIALTWDPPAADCCYYWIYWRNVTAGEGFQKTAYPASKPEHTFTSLRHGDVYEFKVSATNQAGEGPTSGTIRVTSYGGLPAPPSGLTATAGDGRVTLGWNASPTPNVYYWIYYRAAGEGWQRTQYPTDKLSFTATFLTNGITYEYFVTATNASGDSGRSNIASARPMPPLPAPPSGLTATPGDGKVTLRWNASPTGSVYYWIEMRDVTAGENWHRLKYPTDKTSHTVEYLVNGHTYSFRVRATNMSGDSAPSNVASARPLPPFPQAPTNLHFSLWGNGELWFAWNPSATANVYYWIEMRDVTAGEGWRRMPYPTPNTRFEAKYLTNGHYYEFRVRATNAAGDSAPSNVIQGRPMPPRPQAPTALRADSGRDWIKLYFDASSTPYVHHYRVYGRDATAGHGFSLLTTGGCCWSYWPGRTPGHAYEFYVVAVDYVGQWSDQSYKYTMRTEAVPLQQNETNWWGANIYYSREGTTRFIQDAEMISDHWGLCASLVGRLGVPGRMAGAACSVGSAQFETFARQAREFQVDGDCVRYTLFLYNSWSSWVSREAHRSRNCF